MTSGGAISSLLTAFEFQMSKLSLHSIEDKPPEELPVLSPAELEAIEDPDAITKRIALLEAQCHEQRPNLGAIAEYKKKVSLITLH